jgi:hypothetical protein
MINQDLAISLPDGYALLLIAVLLFLRLQYYLTKSGVQRRHP